VQVVRKLAEADVAHDFEAMVVHPPRTRDELFVASFWIGHPLKFSWPQSVETVVHPPDKHAWHSPFGYAFAHSVVEPCVAELVSQPPQRATRTASLLPPMGRLERVPEGASSFAFGTGDLDGTSTAGLCGC